jgi:hypothetical protein
VQARGADELGSPHSARCSATDGMAVADRLTNRPLLADEQHAA